MKDVQTVAKKNKLSLTETIILMRIYDMDPDMVKLQDLIDEENFSDVIINEVNALVRKKIVKMYGTESGIVYGLV